MKAYFPTVGYNQVNSALLEMIVTLEKPIKSNTYNPITILFQFCANLIRVFFLARFKKLQYRLEANVLTPTEYVKTVNNRTYYGLRSANKEWQTFCQECN